MQQPLRCFVLVSIVALLATGSLGSVSSARGAEALAEYQRLFATWNTALDDGRYVEAEKHAQDLLAVSRRSFPNDIGKLGLALQCLGLAYSREGRYAEAEPVYLQSMSLMERVVGPEHGAMGETISNLANCYMHQGRLYEAEVLHKRSVQIAEAQHQREGGLPHVDLAHSLNNLGNVYLQQNKLADAEWAYQRAIKTYQTVAGPDSAELASSLGNLALVYQLQRDFARSEPICRRALELRQKTLRADHPDIGRSLCTLGNVDRELKKFDEAETLYKRALKIAEQNHGPNHPDVAFALADLGSLFKAQKRYADGEPFVNRAIEILDKSNGDRVLHSDCYHHRAEMRWHTGRRDEAITDVQQSLKINDELRTQIAGAEKARADFSTGYSPVQELLVDWQIELGNLDEAFAAAERSRSRTLTDQMKLQGVDVLASLPPAEAQQFRQREAAAQVAIASLEKQIDQLSRRTDLPAAQKERAELALSRQLAEARQQQVDVYVDIRNASPSYRLTVGDDFQPIKLSQLQSWVAKQDSLMLQYFVGEENSFLFIFGADEKPRVVRLSLSEEAAKQLGVEAGPLNADRLKAAFTVGGQDLPQRMAAAEKNAAITDRLALLWKILIPETEREALVAGKYQRLIVIPDGALETLPFDALVVEPGAEPVYLLDRGPPIISGPQATLLYNLLQRGVSDSTVKGDRSAVLTVGDPVYTPPRPASQSTTPPATSATELIASFRPNSRFASRSQLKPLPYSRNEVSWVAEMFGKMGYGADKLLRAEATEANVRSAAAGREVIHLACHGLVDNQFGNFFGALALTPGSRAAKNSADDGFLTLPEIYDLNLKGCEVAILSACQTNYGPQQIGEGVWALSRGFLVAGSRRVIASNWLVDDAAAASLVSVFCSHLAKQRQANEPLDYAKALHEAKRWVRKQEKWRHPYYWGSFVLIGPG
jgi:CHAT domain-containing protein